MQDLTQRAAIDAFLSHKRIAFVGLSTREGDFSRRVAHTLRDNEFDVVPVNPKAPEIEGRPCFARIDEVMPPVDAALVMTSPAHALEAVEQCDRAGVKQVWLHRGVGPGSATPEAVRYCHDHGMSVVAGQCPLMFVGHPPDSVHRAHATLKKVAGTYPAERPHWLKPALFYLPVIGWALCGLVMYLGLRWLPLEAVLVTHAVAAPIIFGLLARRYYRYRDRPLPLEVAAIFTGMTAALDLVVVALLVEGSFAMFRDPLGTWVPFALIFATVWKVGRVTLRERGAWPLQL